MHLSKYPFLLLSINLSTCLSIYGVACLSTYLISIYLLPLSFYLSKPSTYLPCYVPICPACLSSICLSSLSTSLSNCLSLCLFISFCLPIWLPIYRQSPVSLTTYASIFNMHNMQLCICAYSLHTSYFLPSLSCKVPTPQATKRSPQGQQGQRQQKEHARAAATQNRSPQGGTG